MVAPKNLDREIAAAIKSLSKWPGVRRIWLFGSVAKGAPLDGRSDLDFSAEGMSAEVYCRAWAELDEALAWPADLVRWESASDVLRDQITRWGKVIYEA